IGVEFNEICSTLGPLLDEIDINTLHMSWNLKTFWSKTPAKITTGNKIKYIGEVDIHRWLYGIHIKRIILDRDYVISSAESINTIIEVSKVLQKMMPHVVVEVCPGRCSFNIENFANYCHI
ncbi:hypothetical protein RFI_00226, partial [Reticulomyxa filosa]